MTATRMSLMATSIVAAVALARPGFTAQYCVDQGGGDDENSGAVWSDCWATVTRAFDCGHSTCVQAGDILNVKGPYTYEDQKIELDSDHDGVTIRGYPWIQDPTGAQPVFSPSGDDEWWMDICGATGVALRRIHVDGYSSGIWVGCSADDVELELLTIVLPATSPYNFLYGVATSEVLGVSIRECSIYAAAPSTMETNGIWTTDTSVGVEMELNTLGPDLKYPIIQESCPGGVIAWNDIEGGRYGIYLFGDTSNRIVNNVVHDQTTVGIQLESDGNVLVDNVVYDVPIGIRIESSHNRLRENELFHHTDGGIVILRGEANRLVGDDVAY